MAERIYPDTDLERPDRLADELGGFWSGVFSDEVGVRALAAGRGRLEQQTERLVAEAVDSLGVSTVPVHSLDLWYPLRLLESETNREDLSLNRYGGGGVFGPQPGSGFVSQYGVPDSLGWYAFPLPAEVVEAPLVLDRPLSPVIAWISGLDHTVEPGAIRLRQNPFATPGLSPVDVHDSAGLVVDRELLLWIRGARLDRGHLRQHVGELLHVSLPSTHGYRDWLDGTWGGIVEGGHWLAVARCLAAITGCPAAGVDGELVQVVSRQDDALVVVTDQAAYRCPPDAAAVVSVGDTLLAGSPLVDGWSIHEFHTGEVPAGLLAVTLSASRLGSEFQGGLTFRNASVPLEVDTSEAITRVSFELGGWPGDVSLFWDNVHDKGVAQGRTLANMLDRRENQVGEPGPSNLPAEINPLEFLAQNVLRSNCFLIRLHPGSFGAERLPLWLVDQLRRIVPPHTGYLVSVEPTLSDTIDPTNPGDEDAAGTEEDQLPYLAATPLVDEIDPADLVVESLTARYLNGVCL